VFYWDIGDCCEGSIIPVDGWYLARFPGCPDAVFCGPEILLQSHLLKFGAIVDWGQEVDSTTSAWNALHKEILQAPDLLELFPNWHRKFEEFVAGAYRTAHVIITNSMEESAMVNAANWMKTQHKLGSEFPDFLLVFVRDSFLTLLWNRVREAEGEFDRRGTYLEEYFVAAIKDGIADGYCLLDGDSANSLADRVLSEPPIKDPIDADKLKKDLKEQIVRKPTKGRKVAASGK
jgi:hypothetical protein